jgi:hypothetical protein
MSRWFRLDDDIINDPKILLLPEPLRWIWISFLCIASKNGGAIPKIEIVALSLRVKPTRAAEYLTRLVNAGLIDRTETGFEPHNWNGRQFKSDVSTERVKRCRELKRNVSVTPPETEAETQTEAQPEKKETREDALDDWPRDYREQFWQAYPNKVGKPKALGKLDGIRKRGVVFSDIMDGLARYIRAKPNDRSWLNPETFLNQERWTDQPAPQGNPNGKNNGHHEKLGYSGLAAQIRQRNAERENGGPPTAEPDADDFLPFR